MKKAFTVLVNWLVNQPGWLMLIADNTRLQSAPPERLGGAWWQVLALSAAWGVGQAGLWALAWKAPQGRAALPIMPVAAVLAVTFLWTYRRAAAALVDAVVGEPDRPLGMAVIVAMWALILLALRGWNEQWSAANPWWLMWLRPHGVLRPLLLAPLWGAWAMMATCLFCRRTYTTQPAVLAFADRCGPLATAAVMGGVLALSIWYFNYLPWIQVTISGVTIVAAVIAGLVFSRRGRRLTRDVLLATNLLTQTAFLLAYIANRT